MENKDEIKEAHMILIAHKEGEIEIKPEMKIIAFKDKKGRIINGLDGGLYDKFVEKIKEC